MASVQAMNVQRGGCCFETFGLYTSVSAWSAIIDELHNLVQLCDIMRYPHKQKHGLSLQDG